MLGYQLIMYDGRGHMKKIQNNEFPNVKPITISDFLK